MFGNREKVRIFAFANEEVTGLEVQDIHGKLGCDSIFHIYNRISVSRHLPFGSTEVW